MGVTLRLARFVRPYTGKFTIAVLCSVASALFQVRVAALVQPLVDNVLIRSSPEHLRSFCLGLLLLIFCKGLFDYFSHYLMAYVGQSVVRDLRDRLYDSLLSQPLGFFHFQTTGALSSRVTFDVARVQTAISEHVRDLVRGSASFLGLIGYMFWLDWRLTLLSLVLIPVLVLPIVQFTRRLRRTSLKTQESIGSMSSLLHDVLSGIRIVKAYQAEDFEGVRFRKTSERQRRLNLRAQRVIALSSPLLELMGAVIFAVLVAYAYRRISSGLMTPGAFMSFLVASIVLYRPIKEFANANNVIQQGLVCAERVFEILDLPVEVPEAPGAGTLPNLREEIRFRGVSFSYGERAVLDGIDLTVRAGEVVALVGESGAGKTTLVNLLPRFFDAQKGALLFDGKDIREVTLRSLRAQIGIVTQDVILFNDTVRANIAYALPGARDEDIREAARAANAVEFIEQLPQGYDTSLGDQGSQLSGGQRQRIAIARALLKNAPILILDEATSNLDARSERLVQDALQNLMKGRTVFIIAHRLTTVLHADRIVVLDHGKIVEAGTHSELLGRGGAYARLHLFHEGARTPA